MTHNARLNRVIATAGALLLAVVASVGVAEAESRHSASGDTTPAEVIIGLRVWQDVNDADSLYVSARPEGGNWRSFGTVPFTLGPQGGTAPTRSINTVTFTSLASDCGSRDM